MIDLFSEASAIARNMLAKYLDAAPNVRDHIPGASSARNAWDKVEHELLKEGWDDVVKSSKSNPGNIPYNLPRPLMKLMKKNDAFAGELRQLYDSYLMETTSAMFNVSQEIDHISGSGKVVGVSKFNTKMMDIKENIFSSEPKPPTDSQTNLE
jgi:hypothetical protein